MQNEKCRMENKKISRKENWIYVRGIKRETSLSTIRHPSFRILHFQNIIQYKITEP